MSSRKKIVENVEVKEPLGSINVTLPFDEKRLEVIGKLANSILELTKALNVPTQISIANCTIHPEVGAAGINIQ